MFRRSIIWLHEKRDDVQEDIVILGMIFAMSLLQENIREAERRRRTLPDSGEEW